MAVREEVRATISDNQSCHPRPSEAINGPHVGRELTDPLQSAAISGHQRPSEAISGHQRPSEARTWAVSSRIRWWAA